MTIISDNQVKLLKLLSNEPGVTKNFYLTGGTALAEFYLQHRYSEDLDFFSEKEFEPENIVVVLRKIQAAASIKRIRYEQSFNRNLYFLELTKDTIKTEFTYFPFPRLEQKKKFEQLAVDSLLDIAVNKIFSIYQKPRARDFVDLYLIFKREAWTIDDLALKAQAKFDHYLNPVQLGAQFVQVGEVKDYPRMIKSLEPREWQKFFLAEAKKLKNKVLE